MASISPESGSQVQHQLADLAVLAYEKLLHKDKTEFANLYNACKEWGFFHLDLSGSTSAGNLQNA